MTCGAFKGLSRRELEVLALVAGGQTDRAIAATLEPTVSEETVAEYLRRIFRKLGVNSRVAAAAIFVRHQRHAAGEGAATDEPARR